MLILMHDPKIDRTTTGKGTISELTYDSIAKTHLKNGCNIRTIHRVPTLEEALVHARGKIMLNLDKADRYFEQVYELMKKTGTTKQIVMKGTKSAEKVKELYGERIAEINKNLPPYSTIKYFALVAREFSIEGGELTPTLKLKRKEIYSKYRQIIDELYSSNGNGMVLQEKNINGEEK